MPQSTEPTGLAGFQLAMIETLLLRLRNRRLRRMLRHYEAVLRHHVEVTPHEPVTQPLISDYILRAMFALQREQA